MSRSFSEVNRRASPPFTGRTKIFSRDSHGCRKEMVWPSGDRSYPRLTGLRKKSRTGILGGIFDVGDGAGVWAKRKPPTRNEINAKRIIFITESFSLTKPEAGLDSGSRAVQSPFDLS